MNSYKKAIFEKKYRFNKETPDDFYKRVSGGSKLLEQLLREDKFTFAGRILTNRGTASDKRKITYSNCYVMPKPSDNLESIFDTGKFIARIYSYGGGCGIDLGNLRPTGSIVHNSAKTTTGPVSFMPLYSLITEIIGQDGRQGALMLSMPSTHPDLEEFIDIKTKVGAVEKANISIRFDDKFMEAVESESEYVQRFHVHDTRQTVEKVVDASELFSKFVINNWNWAEPGALFWDRIESWNLLSEDDDFEYHGVNPCAEEPLPAGGSCLLGSINLSAFVENPHTDYAALNMDKLQDAITTGVVSLNVVLDEGLYLHPLQIVQESVRDWRQIGLGLMGYADMLIKLGVKYGSEDAISITECIGKLLVDQALFTSSLLAKDYGTYPKYNAEAVLKSPFLLENASPSTLAHIKEHGLRNSQLLTIAPTGSTAPLLGTSWATEPIYDVAYIVKTESLDAEESYYEVEVPIIKELMKTKGISSIHELPDYVVTAKTISVEDRIKTQATLQKFIDASISSTVNLHESATPQDVYDAYLLAWKLGCKGITIYRDKCKRSGVLESIEDKCPNCGSNVQINEGCKTCSNPECGWGGCSI